MKDTEAVNAYLKAKEALEKLKRAGLVSAQEFLDQTRELQGKYLQPERWDGQS